MAIAAISTPAGTGGIAVIRISGKDALEITSRIWKGADLRSAPSHTAHLGWVLDSRGQKTDQCVATVFKAPNSYTGYDTVELSVHGSPWIQKEVLRILTEAGATPAGPGEFTKEAFLNGRLDLAQAEAVADLMGADSRAAANVALTQLAGGYSSKLNQLRQRLTDLAALLELELDFSEEDVEFADRTELYRNADALEQEIKQLADSYLNGKIYKEGVSIVLAGVPNAGKSSLLNVLAQEEKALVTPIAGTTRDIIEAKTEINGITCRFYDTAGLHTTDNHVENLGINRAKERISQSRIVIWLVDPTQPQKTQQQELDKIKTLLPQTATLITASTKADLADTKTGLSISSKTGEGVELLKKAITEATGLAPGDSETAATVTNLRHYRELQSALPYLERLRQNLPADLMAEELRGALRHLSAITGTVTTPDILQTIFSRFCIGK